MKAKSGQLWADVVNNEGRFIKSDTFFELINETKI